MSILSSPLCRSGCSADSFSALQGKSSLVVRYVEEAFVDAYYPTIENVFNKAIKYKNVEFDCDIIDTAGQVSSAVDQSDAGEKTSRASKAGSCLVEPLLLLQGSR